MSSSLGFCIFILDEIIYPLLMFAGVAIVNLFSSGLTLFYISVNNKKQKKSKKKYFWVKVKTWDSLNLWILF